MHVECILCVICELSVGTSHLVPQAGVCHEADRNLITKHIEMVDTWRQLFEKHLNGDTADGSGAGIYFGEPAADDRLLVPDLQEIFRETEKNNARTTKPLKKTL